MNSVMTIQQRTADHNVSVQYIGNEREPVVVVDRALGNVDGLVDYAATRSTFAGAASVGIGYPGLLGPAPADYIDRMVRLVLPLIAEYFGVGAVMPVRARGNFSLVTTDPTALTPDQRVPHVDAVDRLQFATVHYLCGERHGGTGFFRHRDTGFETVDAARAAGYQSALDREMADPANLPTGYPGAIDDSLFARIHDVAARPDRLILYRAALLHSGLIATVDATAADPRRGRLTGNLFLTGRSAA
ncbi:hypothetical protein C8J44_0257 [Sphingomonas sp. PP-CE-3A-406]|nr:hypothetical protein C8J44_0257 [Sphingomonas sp. PP-CE-3A-406]